MDWTARLVAIFESRIERRITYAGLSKLFKRGKTFALKLKAHLRGPRVGDVLRSLELAGDEKPQDFFHQAMETVPRDVVGILACNREHQGLDPSPFLVAMAPRLLALANEPGEAGAWRSRLSTIRRFEKLRLADHPLATRKLEWLIGLGVKLLERHGSRPARALGDLACALASLAAVYRQSGRRDDALDALLLAHPLTVASDDPRAEGIWRQKGAFLLVDLDRCDRAQEFLEEAATLFLLANARSEVVEVMVDLGFVLSHAGRSEEANKWLRRVLPLVPPGDRESLFAVHQLLALQLERVGQSLEARDQLEIAEGLVEGDKLALASLQWSRARHSVKLGEAGKAVEAYRAALALYERHGSEADMAKLSFEFAGLLITENRRPELMDLTAGLSRWLDEAQRNQKVREAFEDLAALAVMKRVDIDALDELRRSLPSEEPRPAQKRQKAQPWGGYSGPISGSSPIAELLFGGKFSSLVKPSDAG
jgi:tetratricopeptide (TPR) repeat protein